jgi:hypothetical protein
VKHCSYNEHHYCSHLVFLYNFTVAIGTSVQEGVKRDAHVPETPYFRLTPCECHFASLSPNLIMYFRVHGTLMAADARTNASKNTEARNAPTVFSKPASQPDWSCQPSGFSSLLMSKKRLVPKRSMSICVSSKASIRNLHEYPFQSKLSLGLQWHLSLSRKSSPVGQCVNGT